METDIINGAHETDAGLETCAKISYFQKMRHSIYIMETCVDTHFFQP